MTACDTDPAAALSNRAPCSRLSFLLLALPDSRAAARPPADQLLFGKHGESLAPIPVPPEMLVIEGSPRDPTQGKPSAVFRYDIIYELTSAICEDRDAVPSFKEGAMTQMVADGVLESSESRKWLDLDFTTFGIAK